MNCENDYNNDPREERYMLFRGPKDETPEFYHLLDRYTALCITWERGHFNDRQSVKDMTDPKANATPLTATQLATAMREAADYLVANYPELL